MGVEKSAPITEFACMKQVNINALIKVPDEWSAEHLEQFTTNLISMLHSMRLEVLDVRWSCPGLISKKRPLKPVLVFKR